MKAICIGATSGGSGKPLGIILFVISEAVRYDGICNPLQNAPTTKNYAQAAASKKFPGGSRLYGNDAELLPFCDKEQL